MEEKAKFMSLLSSRSQFAQEKEKVNLFHAHNTSAATNHGATRLCVPCSRTIPVSSFIFTWENGNDFDWKIFQTSDFMAFRYSNSYEKCFTRFLLWWPTIRILDEKELNWRLFYECRSKFDHQTDWTGHQWIKWWQTLSKMRKWGEERERGRVTTGCRCCHQENDFDDSDDDCWRSSPAEGIKWCD